MDFYAISDKGKVRARNEDYVSAFEKAGCAVLVLADGMGGASAGEVASRVVGESICEYITKRLCKNMSPGKIFSLLRESIAYANTAAFNMAATDKKLRGMGTTAEVCITAGCAAYAAHVGDSRIYKISAQKKLLQITRDDSLVGHMVEIGAITPEQAETHPQRNVITRAVGIDKYVDVQTYAIELKSGDRLLVCSDGLSDMIKSDELLCLAIGGTCEQCAKKLVAAANDAGGVDNVSVILADVEAQ